MAILETRHLVDQCLAGHASAASELVRRYSMQVYSLCYRFLGHREDAEDARQETFMRALRSLRCWNPARDFEPWLLTIAANRCRTMLARRASRPPMQPLVEQELGCASPAPRALDLEEELSLALAELRDNYREAFVLFHQRQLSYDEISCRMGSPVGTVKAWVHRARLELMEHLVRRGLVEE